MDPETQPFLESSNPRLVAASMLVGSYYALWQSNIAIENHHVELR